MSCGDISGLPATSWAHLSRSISHLNSAPNPLSADTTWLIFLPLFLYSCKSHSSEHPSLLLCPMESYASLQDQLKVLLNQQSCERCSPDATECSTCSAFHARSGLGLVSLCLAASFLRAGLSVIYFPIPHSTCHVAGANRCLVSDPGLIYFPCHLLLLFFKIPVTMIWLNMSSKGRHQACSGGTAI